MNCHNLFFGIAFLNPKIAVFFLALLGSFLPVDAGAGERVGVAGLAMCIDGLWYMFAAVMLAGSGAATWMIEEGCRAREDMIDKTRARTMKMVPEVQVARVSTMLAWRPPRMPSVMAAPPPTAASPPPFPDWRRMMTVMRMPSNTRRASNNPYI